MMRSYKGLSKILLPTRFGETRHQRGFSAAAGGILVMSLASEGARGGLTTVVSQAFSITIRLAGLILLARLLPPDVFGLAAIIVAITSFASTLIYLGLPMAVLQVESISEKAKTSLLLINTVLGLVLGCILFLAASPIASFYNDPRLAVMMKSLAVLPLLGGIQSQFRLHLIKQLKFTGLAVTDVLAQLLSTVAAVMLAIRGYAIEAIIWQSIVQGGAQLVFTVMLARWLPERPGAWATEVKELLLVGLRIFGATALRDSSRSIVVPVMGTTVPSSALGNFDRAQQIAILPINLTVDQLQRVAVPVLSRLRKEPEKMYAYMRRAQLMLTYLTATVFMLTAGLAEVLVVTVLGPEWRLAGQILQVLSLGAVFRTLGQSMQWLFIATGTTKIALNLSLWSQPLIVIITLLGLPWGVMGVAVANSIAWALYWPLATITATRASNFRAAPLMADAGRGILVFGLPIFVISSVISHLDIGSWLQLIGGTAIACLVGVILAFSIGTVRRDLADVLRVFRLAFGK